MCTCTLSSCVHTHTHTHRHRVGTHSNIYQATYACLTQSCDMKCNWSVLFTTFRTNCCPHVLIICGDEETKDEKLTKVMFLLENVEVLSKLDMWMSTAVVKHHYGVAKRPMFHQFQNFLVSVNYHYPFLKVEKGLMCMTGRWCRNCHQLVVMMWGRWPCQ